MGNLWERYGHLPAPEPYIPVEKRKAIHITDLSSYAGGCRRQWDWSSPLRQGLQPSILPAPLALGQGVHVALDAGYSLGPASFDCTAGLKAFSVWFKQRRKRSEEYSGPLWQEEIKDLETLRELGRVMLFHYHLWAEPLDRGYEIVATEKRFNIPIPGTRDLVYSGRMDGIIRELNTGRMYILEFKTTRSLKYMSSIFRGIQTTAYLWAARELFGPQVHGILYRAMLKRVPDSPVPLKRGGYSRRKTIKSTYDWYRHCLRSTADALGMTPDEAMKLAAAALDMLRQRDNEFFLQAKLTRPQLMIDQTLETLRCIGREMANSRTPTPAISGFHCSWCSFKDPCDLRNRGYDYQAVIDAEYARRDYWEADDATT